MKNKFADWHRYRHLSTLTPLSPYHPPETNEASVLDVASPTETASARVLYLVNALSALVSVPGLSGAYMYAVEPQANPDRYQLTVLPMLSFVIGLVPMVIGLVCLWRTRRVLRGLKRFLVVLVLLLPAVGVLGLAGSDLWYNPI